MKGTRREEFRVKGSNTRGQGEGVQKGKIVEREDKKERKQSKGI